MKSMNLRFPDEATYEAIKTAASVAGVSMQQYVADAAADRALAKQKAFVEAALEHRDTIAAAFADVDPDDADPTSLRNMVSTATDTHMAAEADDAQGNAA
ncbi:hypothetical protein ACIP98_29040 [Streptomyces sp. NPDC088354]|uniref:hypothetical protein n=1 Tax=Streptomyces sp. NPDC088354 TaxID=3365856 RepID=UPI00381AE821